MRQPQYDDRIASSAKLGMELVATGKVIRRYLSREAARLGLQDGEWGVLIHLRRSGENISQKDLAWRLGNEPHAVVRLLVNMEKAGIVRRAVDARDARGRLVSLTDRGRDVADQIIRLVDQFEQTLVEDLSEAEILHAVTIVRQMRAKLTAGDG
jgi:MarR family transcriptional regulator for hemolysin